MKVRRIFPVQIFIVFILFSTGLHAETVTPVGKWKTIDDATGAEKSIVEIQEINGVLTGKIVQLFRKPDEDQRPVCDKCSGDRKDQPMLGMTILWDLKKDGNEWSGGMILDPKNGKTYRCFLKLQDGGSKLAVRGFIGFSLIGRTQTWVRASD